MTSNGAQHEGQGAGPKPGTERPADRASDLEHALLTLRQLVDAREHQPLDALGQATGAEVGTARAVNRTFVARRLHIVRRESLERVARASGRYGLS